MKKDHLGKLEGEIMDVMWNSRESEGLTVLQVRQLLNRQLAPTTVSTTLLRLDRNGFLQRHKKGRAFLFRVADGRSALDDWMLVEIVRLLRSQAQSLGVESLVSHLVDAIGDCDGELLERLETKIRARRSQLQDADRTPGHTPESPQTEVPEQHRASGGAAEAPTPPDREA